MSRAGARRQVDSLATVVRPRVGLQVALGLSVGIASVEWLPHASNLTEWAYVFAALLLILVRPRWTLIVLAALLGSWRYAAWNEVKPVNPAYLPSGAHLRAIGSWEPTRTGGRLLCAFMGERDAFSKGYALLYFRQTVVHPPDYGDEFILRVSWQRPQNPPGISFDWVRYLQRRRVYYIAVVYHDSQFQMVRSQETSWQRWFQGLRRSLHRLFYARLTQEDAAVMEGIMVGATGDFPRSLREAFMRSGIGHMLSTSGLHVAMALQLLELLLTRLVVPFRWRMGLLILAAWGYALLAGLRPPIARAATMASLYLAAPLLKREADGLNALGWAAAIWLLYAPYSLFEVGFQYSFCAVLFILLFYRRVERALREGWAIFVRQGWLRASGERWLCPLLSVSLCAQAGIGLIQLYHFGYLSLLSPLANLLAAPAAYLALALGSFFWLSHGVGVLPIEVICAWLKWVALTFGAAWVPAVSFHSLPWWLVLGFYGVVLLFAPEPTVEEPEIW
ncbi:ComE operon protein 3 [bacterium HR15]|nr:ComE operon protein 3 [bacterium HR15]